MKTPLTLCLLVAGFTGLASLTAQAQDAPAPAASPAPATPAPASDTAVKHHHKKHHHKRHHHATKTTDAQKPAAEVKPTPTPAQ